ncbi:MAG: NifU family protein [Planctomycetia bacterium]|nr:NifU family protein [Planctomycetia bacterium]
MSAESAEFRNKFSRVAELVRSLEELPDTAAREAARQLVRVILDIHASGLRRVLELAGCEAASRIVDDVCLSGLLLLHGLHPLFAEERVSRALEQARPHFHSLGGDVELVSASEVVVRVRLRGNSAAGERLRALAGELVIDAVPDVESLEFEEAWDRAPDGRLSLPVIPRATE